MPERLHEAITEHLDDCWVSPVSAWELGKLRERQRVDLPDDFRGWLADAKRAFPWREAPLNEEIAVASLELDLPSADPADRFLSATALVFDLELVTVDRMLLEAASMPTFSP